MNKIKLRCYPIRYCLSFLYVEFVALFFFILSLIETDLYDNPLAEGFWGVVCAIEFPLISIVMIIVLLRELQFAEITDDEIVLKNCFGIMVRRKTDD